MIACYLDKILLPKLKTFGVSNDFCNYTIETIACYDNISEVDALETISYTKNGIANKKAKSAGALNPACSISQSIPR